MRHFFSVISALLLVLVWMSRAEGQTATIPNASFESGQKQPDDWTVRGDVTLDEKEKIDGDRSLLLKRDPVNLPETSAMSAKFPISPGVWELSGAYAGALNSPDVSFNVSISIQSFDAAGKPLKTRRLVAASGKMEWTHFKERLDVPAGAASASVEIAFNKTDGEFHVDGLDLKYIGASVPMEGGDRKIVFKTNRIGNLFYPGDHVSWEMTVETPATLEGAKLRTGWQVTDFYGSPETAPQETKLEPAGKSAKGWNIYHAVLDATTLPLVSGPYYELHTTVDLGAASPAREVASFAILPEAVTKDLDPLSTPFGAHTWNATEYKYFPLAARLGIRRCLVFWSWPDKAPYTPDFDHGFGHDSRIGWPKRFGLAPYGVLYPLSNIEHHEGQTYSEEALREGIRQSIEKYQQDGLWGFQMGNEPPSANPDWVKADVAAYKTVYEAIKKTDPNMIAIGSSIGPNEAFFKAGFQNYLDVYNVHAYADLGELRYAMQKYQELFKKYGGKKPIWSSEIGSKSQGLPRDVIARDIIHKAICFFADGGGFFTWFAVGGMSDPDGERAGSYSDSMDLFASKYDMQLPRIDAVAFYHLINTLATKTFVSETKYPDGIHAFLFRDKFANSLYVLWNESEPQDVFLPLPDIHEVALRWMNGNGRKLEANGKGINLRLGEDPLFVSFRSDNTPLPADLAAAQAVTLEPLPQALIQGQTLEVKVKAADGRALELSGPATWKIEAPAEQKGAGGSRELTWRVTVPEDATARIAAFKISDQTVTAQGDTELRFAVPVKSKVEVNLMPVAGKQEGDSEVKLTLANLSDKPQPVTWNASIIDELPMAGGTYNLADTKPSSAFFDGLATDKLTLAPRETKEILLPMKGTDRLTLYKLRATATDADGNSVQRERRVGGFARAVHATSKITLDGKFDESFWKEAPVYKINEHRQFCAVVKEAKPWGGLQDLSGTLRFAWDDQYLYVAAEVTDDIFSNPKSDDQMWNQDGLQFLIDPFRGEGQSLGRYDYSLGLGQKGLQAWCHMSADASAPAGLAPEIKFAVLPTSTENGNRNYEVAIPWTRLAPFKPKPGADLGLSMVINDDDGPGRMSTMGWFGGVHLKEANFVGDVVLEK